MIPAVRIPAGAKLRTPVEIKLKPGWRFDAARRVFISDEGERFTPRGELPKNTRIVHKTPGLVAAARAGKAKKLSAAEANLLRYLQIILPADRSPAESLEAVRQWPCVEEAALPPEISLPGGGQGPGLLPAR
ncbi:MAG: hypothetical protein QOE70_1238 [Chthoniobacter sp.]|jgi:hypothetical protein|nr:hypothetical protein [Chthoniobacter sp.]